MKLTFVMCPDREWNGLYRDGVLVYDSPPDYLDSETLRHLVEHKVINAEYELFYLREKDYDEQIDGAGLPKDLTVIAHT